jgi:putative ABC transport system permease protein
VNFVSEIKEGSRIAWGALRANKIRSGLTTLGIVIGIVTVTLMGAAITGLNRFFTESFSILGADILYVEQFSWFNNEQEWMAARNRPQITFAQARALERQITGVRAVAPASFERSTIRYNGKSGGNAFVVGSTEQFEITAGLTVAQGRYMSASEVSGGRPVCVIGDAILEKFFPYESPLGKTIMLGDHTFEIIGVNEKRGKFLGLFSLDEEVHIPITQFIAHFDNRPDMRVDIKVADIGQLEETREELLGVMRKIRQIKPGEKDDFAINQQDMFIKNFNKLGGTIASIGLFITGLSLFVGGIGIMNIMFVSVTERTKEIGVRKAIGARKRTILVQFLIEAVFICLVGGCIALAIAYPITLLMKQFFPASMNLVVVSTALGVSIVTGVVSGFLPAYRAAKMNPVDALRNE